MKPLRIFALTAVATSLVLANSCFAQDRGQLTLKYALDGRTDSVKPGRFFGPEIKTPRKGAPFLYAAWREDIGAERSPEYKSTLVMLNVYQDDPKRYGLGIAVHKDRKDVHYASRCSPKTMPKCDPATNGLRHDAAGKKIIATNAVFERVSLDKTDPKDTITVSGELSYAP